MIVAPCKAQDPRMRRISLRTPARVRTSPDAAPIRKTEDRLRANVAHALIGKSQYFELLDQHARKRENSLEEQSRNSD